MGRHSTFKPEYVRLAYHLALLEARDKDLADAFGVHETTVNTWKRKHPEFVEALNRGKAPADGKVARSLYQRAVGHLNKKGHRVSDTTAAIFWLKCRRSDLWRDKHVIEHEGELPQIVVE